jgi:hypothetical protein
MVTEIARQEVNRRAFVGRENKRECTKDDEDTRAARQIIMPKNKLIIFLS